MALHPIAVAVAFSTMVPIQLVVAQTCTAKHYEYDSDISECPHYTTAFDCCGIWCSDCTSSSCSDPFCTWTPGVTTTTVYSDRHDSDSESNSSGAAIGIAVSSLLIVACFAGGSFLYLRRKRKLSQPPAGDVESGDVESGDVESGDVESGDVESGDVESGAALDTTLGLGSASARCQMGCFNIMSRCEDALKTTFPKSGQKPSASATDSESLDSSASSGSAAACPPVDDYANSEDPEGGICCVSVLCEHCGAAVVLLSNVGGDLSEYTCTTCNAVNRFHIGGRGSNHVEDALESNVVEEPPPHYWDLLPGETKSNFVMESNDIRQAMQQLLDNTWKNQWTRDRGGGKVMKYEVVMVQRNENSHIWSSYSKTRERIAQSMPEANPKYSVKTQSEIGAHDDNANKLLSRAALEANCNEFYLFHGTNPTAAKAICDNHFLVQLSGSNRGSLYGPGIYFAESSSKSDEYATEDNSGIFKGLYALLVCRVCCGNVNYNDEVSPPVQTLVDSVVDKHTHHSILGDREKCRGTFREFIVFDKDQAYPEYVVIYKRVREN